MPDTFNSVFFFFLYNNCERYLFNCFMIRKIWKLLQKVSQVSNFMSVLSSSIACYNFQKKKQLFSTSLGFQKVKTEIGRQPIEALI